MTMKNQNCGKCCLKAYNIIVSMYMSARVFAMTREMPFSHAKRVDNHVGKALEAFSSFLRIKIHALPSSPLPPLSLSLCFFVLVLTRETHEKFKHLYCLVSL